jgi:hypothetical protein
MRNIFDVAIIGMGVAGAFCTYKLSKENKDMKIICFDIGRPPAKRRAQCVGFLGCLPNSSGQFFLNDINKLSNIVGTRKANASFKTVSKILSNIYDFQITKDKTPSISTIKKINKLGYNYTTNDYIQTYPKEIHALSRFIANEILENQNINFNFDEEVENISKIEKKLFQIDTEDKQFYARKVLICTGRDGWRWASEVYSKFGIIENNDVARYGIRIELPSTSVKEFNKSNCTIFQGNDLEVGPFSWFGTVIPEDHVDFAISAFRENENRWKSDKVSFAFIGNRPVNGDGWEQTDRMGKLTFLLANDRIIKEKVSSLLSKKSTLSIIPEYDWLPESIKQFSRIVPDILTKAYFHVPTILPLVPEINIGSNLETEVGGLYVAGESAGIIGLLAAACSGTLAAANFAK